MKKIIRLLLLCFLICLDVNSQTVSKEMALQVAENFWRVNSSENIREPILVQPWGESVQPTMYVCSLSDRWVLIAGDKRIQPILAYSDENSEAFPRNDEMPPAMQYLIEWYSSQIEAVRNDSVHKPMNSQWGNTFRNKNINLRNREAIIAPLLSRGGSEVAWGQRGNNNGNNIAKSYNKFCPSVNDSLQQCEHALVGCVAVAISQVMWYWQWPYTAIVKDDNYQSLLRYYDWTLMPSQLTDTSSISQANMVANLLHDVGVSVNMNYGCSGSSALPSYIASSLRNMFYYTADNLKYRSSYSDSIWLTMIKDELNQFSPVLYGGQRPGGRAHRFVIDGYDSDNFFHVNYGWKGSGNGNFTLNSITYNSNQSMVMNIRPNYPTCTLLTIPVSEVWTTNFIVQNGGGITIGDRSISNGMHGVIFSEEYVKLTSGFKVESGAEVYIDIKDMHCGDDRPIISAPRIRQINQPLIRQNINTTYDSGAQKVFRNGHIYIKRGENVYNISGMRIK